MEQDYGSLDSAIEVAEEAAGLLHHPDDRVSVYVVLGGLYRDTGEHERASSVLGQAAEFAEKHGHANLSLAMILNVQASADRRAGRTADAVKRPRQSVSVGERLGDRKHVAHARHTLAAALLDIGGPQERDEARALLAATATVLRQLNDERGLEMVGHTRDRLERGGGRPFELGAHGPDVAGSTVSRSDE